MYSSLEFLGLGFRVRIPLPIPLHPPLSLAPSLSPSLSPSVSLSLSLSLSLFRSLFPFFSPPHLSFSHFRFLYAVFSLALSLSVWLVSGIAAQWSSSPWGLLAGWGKGDFPLHAGKACWVAYSLYHIGIWSSMKDICHTTPFTKHIHINKDMRYACDRYDEIYMPQTYAHTRCANCIPKSTYP